MKFRKKKNNNNKNQLCRSKKKEKKVLFRRTERVFSVMNKIIRDKIMNDKNAIS